MNKNFQITSRTLLLCGAISFSACQQETKTEEKATTAPATQQATAPASTAPKQPTMMDMMHQNLSVMQQVPITGDIDHDYLTLMTAHHAGAITLTETEIQQGSDTLMQEMARKSMELNKAQRDELEKLANNHKPIKGDPAASKNLQESLDKMMTNMDQAMLGKADYHFAKLMSLHHQSGIEMTDTYLRSARSAAVKELAKKIKASQQKEKNQLEAWMQKNQPE